MSTPRERQIEEFMRRLRSGEINLDNGRTVHRRNLGLLGDLLHTHLQVALVASAPGPADTRVDDIRGRIVATLPDPHIVDGALDASDLTFTALVGPDPFVGAVILADRHIVAYTPFPGPVLPNGSDFTIHWDDGPNRIVRL